MTSIPTNGFMRLPAIIGDRRRGIPAVFPVCRTTWLQGVASGRYPKPVRIGVRAVAWRVEDIRALLAAPAGVTA